ncbi:tyrosine-protein phosphatase 3 [Onthophagus taurus]|uniref:tyrosine-protein phosphatase 3 n=1 Tax=Onthophagus taurus TaxID=166361 RepID=UPI0039BDCDDA
MVLINRLFLGLVLLISSTWSLTNSTTNINTTITTSTINRTRTTSKPEIHDYNLHSGTTSTEIPNEKFKNDDSRSIDMKGGRSLDILADFQIENNVFSDDYAKEQASRTRDYERNFTYDLTTPESDSRFKQIQEDVLKEIDEKSKIIAGEMEEDRRIYYLNHGREAPKNPFLDDVEGKDQFRMEEMKNVDVNEFNDKNNNKTRWEHSVESLKKSESIQIYNQTKIVDDNKTNIQNEVKDIDAKTVKSGDLDQDLSANQQVFNSVNLNNDILINKRIVDEDLTSPIKSTQFFDQDEETTRSNDEVSTIIGDDSTKIVESKKIDDDSTKIDDGTATANDSTIIHDESKKIDDLTTIGEDSTTEMNEKSTTETINQEETTNDVLKIDETTLNDQETIPQETTTQEINKLTQEESTQNDLIETTTFGSFDETNTNIVDLYIDILTNSTEIPPGTTTTTITTTIKYDDDDYEENNATTFYEVTTDKLNLIEKDFSKIEFFDATEKPKRNEIKKNETNSNVANEILKITTQSSNLNVTLTSTESNEVKTNSISTEKNLSRFNFDIIKQNEIKSTPVEDYEDPDDDENNNEHEEDGDKPAVIPLDAKITVKPTKSVLKTTTISREVDENNNVESKPRFVNVTTEIEPVEVEVTTTPAGLVGGEEEDDEGNGGKIAAIVISTVGAVCLLLLVGLLVVMRKRQKRFNYGQRCRPVSLDAYSMDNVSIHNSTRRKGVLMTSKRAYGNAAFDDPNSPSHPLNFSELVKFASNTEEIHAEFETIPQVQAKTSELPEGCEVKNRYANVIPLPETRVFLKTLESDPTSDYINANYVTGAKSERRYYIACQAPLQSTIADFWRMIWEQESKVILMLTHLYEQGAEKCSDYLPPSEVLDCNRLFGDFQVTLKKREVRDKYIISSLQLKNMVSNSWREVTHIWYIEWPHKGVPDEANSLIRFLIEARSYMKANEIKAREANTSFIQGTIPRNPPVIVHCSPGTGRTGTVISCDIAIREFEQSRQVDIPKIVYKIRRDRASSVQTKDQYSFIYKVINLYATKLTGGAFDSF